MGRPGYLSLRITPARRQQLDAIRLIVKVRGSHKELTDAEAIDFAVDWTIASIPERLSARRVGPILRAVKEMTHASEEAARAARATNVPLRAISARVREQESR